MKKSLLLAAASLMVISCSKREFGTQESVPTDNQVRFDAGTSGVAVKVGVDADGHSTFEVGDIIGVYAVNHGKKLGVLPLVSQVGAADGVFPALQNLQFLNKRYLVKTVDAYVTTPTASPALAHFVPNVVGTDEIYYQTGDLGWNYYAYYPTDDITSSTSPFKGLPSNATQATAANFLKTDATLGFMNQTSIVGTDAGTDVYPGPIMFAYANAADKAAKQGETKTATNLAFKYANAKITLDVEMKGTVGIPSDIKSIIMCDDETPLTASGLTSGLNFDLTKADAKGTASGVYDVVAPSTGGAPLTGLPVNATTKLPIATGAVGVATAAYHFGSKTILATSHKDDPTYTSALSGTAALEDKGKDSTLISTTGYLIPAGNVASTPAGTLKNVVIKFYVGSGNSAEVFTAKLDETKGGTLTGVKPGTTPERAYKNFLPKIEPGKEYKFKIVLNKQGVSFTGTIEDWDVVDNTGTTIPAE